MAFQDNSGDIIFDVVLTDEGRRRLAKGDGSFTIVKFALGDEEINYELFNKNQSTAFQDLSILQTPVLEAFTNNTSTMKTKLVSIPQNNLLYLPVIKLNEGDLTRKMVDGGACAGSFTIAVDGATEDNNGNPKAGSKTSIMLDPASGTIRQGFLPGQSIRSDNNYIRVDAGIDSEAVPPAVPMPGILRENAYIVEIDNRLGQIVSRTGTVTLSPSTIDDDQIAQYMLTSADTQFVFNNTSTRTDATEAIAGSRSTYLEFKIASSLSLKQSNFLFTQLGGEAEIANFNGSLPGANNVRFIDTLVKVTGVSTGYSVDIPIRFVKLK